VRILLVFLLSENYFAKREPTKEKTSSSEEGFSFSLFVVFNLQRVKQNVPHI